MCAASFGWCHLVNAYGVKSGWSCGRQVKLCDPVNTCHSVALRDCLGRKNALYKYLILYFTLLYLAGMRRRFTSATCRRACRRHRTPCRSSLNAARRRTTCSRCSTTTIDDVQTSTSPSASRRSTRTSTTSTSSSSSSRSISIPGFPIHENSLSEGISGFQEDWDWDNMTDSTVGLLFLADLAE